METAVCYCSAQGWGMDQRLAEALAHAWNAKKCSTSYDLTPLRFFQEGLYQDTMQYLQMVGIGPKGSA